MHYFILVTTDVMTLFVPVAMHEKVYKVDLLVSLRCRALSDRVNFSNFVFLLYITLMSVFNFTVLLFLSYDPCVFSIKV